jgi:hypothetical protein
MMTAVPSALATVQTAPLIIAVLFGLTFFVIIMFVSFKARNRLTSEIEREHVARPTGQISPVEMRAKQWVVLGLVVAPVILALGLVAAFSTRNNGSIPAWDSWLLFVLFWGTAIFVLTRFVIVRKRRKRSDPRA